MVTEQEYNVLKSMISNKIVGKLERDFDTISDQIVAEIHSKDMYGSVRGAYHHLERIILERFAERFVSENYDKIADQIDLSRVGKMAELKAVSKLHEK